MAINFTCNFCGKSVRAPDQTAGRIGRCPSCGDAITILTRENSEQDESNKTAAVEKESPITSRTQHSPSVADTGANNVFEMVETKSGYAVNKYIGFDDTALTIPAFYNGKPVVAIAKDLLKNCKQITSVRIKARLTEIPSNAFYGCHSLSEISLPDGLEVIRDGAFCGCSCLCNVTIPKTVQTIGAVTSEDWGFEHWSLGAFGGSGITEVAIPDGMTIVDSDTFSNCKSLKSVSISRTVKKIGREAFSNCTSLINVSLGDGVTELDSECFCDCTSLERIVIPRSVTTIGKNVFAVSRICRPDRRYNPFTIHSNNSNLTIACYPGSFAQEYFRGQFNCVRAE